MLFLGPVDFEGGPKNYILEHHVEKNKKKCLQERFRKEHEIYIDFGSKKGSSERGNVVISLDLLQNMRFRRSRNFMKMEVKMASKMDENRSFGCPWAGNSYFGKFLEVLEKG